MVEVFVEQRPEGVLEPTEEAAFADLFNRTYNPLVAYCRRYCPPGYDPEDIAQEALSRAWSSWDRYSPSRPFWPWVATIARRLCVDYWRRDERAIARTGGVAALEPIVQPRPDELSEAADECRMAVNAFRRLRPDHQRIVGLRDIEGWSYEDIARFEGVTVESVRGSLRRARVSLRKSYESLAKGAVPAVAPVLPLVRRFQAARARLALRMARWQAAFHDTGVASTRLGEVLVSLMAISVAAVGFGTPGVGGAGGGEAAGLRPAASSLTPSAAAQSAPVAGAVGRAASAGHGGASQSAAAWTPTVNWKPTNLLAANGATPQNSTIEHFTLSPNYAVDRTIFAAGVAADGCPAICGRVFMSTNGGADWHPLGALGFESDRVLLPPTFGQPGGDNRMFGTGNDVLQVAYPGTDGSIGSQFVPLTPSLGPAVMSPGFSSGDPRILLTDAPGRQYDDRLRATTPLDLTPQLSTVSQRFSFAFPSTFDPLSPVMYVASTDSVSSSLVGTVSRCVGRTCASTVQLSGVRATPSLLTAQYGGHDVLYAWGGNAMYRSLNGGTAFERVSLPKAVGGVGELTTDGAGTVYMFAADMTTSGFPGIWRSTDAGASWARVPTSGIPAGALFTIAAVPDGTLLVGMSSEYGGLACTHDGGKTWAPHC
jgi:RNA polymerase sigma-70 factor (ECF subfamily)